MKVRENLYTKSLLRSYPLPVPVVSVGNLVLGGTGKTPTVRHLAEFLQAQGYRPAIISRGYGGQSAAKTNVVSDAHTVLLGPEQAGDEPYMLACSLPGIPVLTGRRRIHPSRWAVEKLNADILILDDGFQHLAIQRDIDIVLFDGTTLAGNSRIFPGGVLREPIAALNRCTAFLITGLTDKNRRNAECFGELLRNRYKNKPVFYSSVDTCRLSSPVNTQAHDYNIKDTYFGFCGIANPARFEETLKNTGIRLAGLVALPDHARYSQSLMDRICDKAGKAGANQLITTEKDYVKIKALDSSMPLCVLEIRARQEAAFEQFILESLEKSKKNACTDTSDDAHRSPRCCVKNPTS